MAGKQELIRAVTLSKLPPEEIVKRLGKARRGVSLDRLLASEDSNRRKILTKGQGLEGSKSIFSLERLMGVGHPQKT